MFSTLFRNNSKIYYSNILDKWVEERKTTVKESSYLKYYSYIETIIKPYLGNYIFKKLSSKNIDDFFANEKIINLADATKKVILIIIKSSIKYGVNHNYRKQSIKIDVKLKKAKGKNEYLTKDEQETLNIYLKENLDLKNLGIFLTLYTGIRIGELCGLMKKDFDFISGTISINKTVQRVKNIDKNSHSKTKLIVDAPKTEYSLRTIPIPEFLISILYNVISKIENDDQFVFNNSLNPKDPRNYERYYSKVLKDCGIRNLNFHSLRHTFATRACESGMDIKVLSEILGHSSYHITREIYVHISSEFKKESINCLANSLISMDM